MEDLKADLNTYKPYTTREEHNQNCLEYYREHKEELKTKRADYFKEYYKKQKYCAQKSTRA